MLTAGLDWILQEWATIFEHLIQLTGKTNHKTRLIRHDKFNFSMDIELHGKNKDNH